MNLESTERARHADPRVSCHKGELRLEVGLRVAGDRDVRDVVDARAGDPENLLDRMLREPGAVLLPIDALFGNGGDDAVLSYERRRRVRVDRVDSEYESRHSRE